MSARQTPLPPQHLHTDSEAEPVWRWIIHKLPPTDAIDTRAFLRSPSRSRYFRGAKHTDTPNAGRTQRAGTFTIEGTYLIS